MKIKKNGNINKVHFVWIVGKYTNILWINNKNKMLKKRDFMCIICSRNV